MSPFGWLYDRVLQWSRHPHAPWYLSAVSFSESSFFPIPPDVMLAPMTLASPEKWMRLAFITTVASVLGGVLGYFIGYFAIDQVAPYLREWGYWDEMERAGEWFATYGFWAIFIAGFSPIPYKVFTIAAGAAMMVLPVFVFASVVGRGARYLMVAGAVRWGGAPFEAAIRRNVDRLALVTIVVVVLLVVYLKM
ncbi:MAG: DedA family protein [Gammaproteobacteria bacterium]|nr:DedA family protein [Gammaproteobacteria bacterium]